MAKGKSLDDLHLDPNSHIPPDPRGQPWYQFCQEIEELIGTGNYSWAEDTLSGIRDTVQETRIVTDGQRRAVSNVSAARERTDGWRRRYEGYRGRR